MESIRTGLVALMVAMLLGVATSVVAFAQGEDIRVSTDNRMSYRLSWTLTIESAIAIESTTFAVWGGSVAGRNRGDMIPALFFQIFDGATPKAAPRVLLDTSFRPSSKLRVVGIANRFVVFWTDYRLDAPGTYLIEVDTNGNRLGEPRRLGRLPIVGATVSERRIFRDRDTGARSAGRMERSVDR